MDYRRNDKMSYIKISSVPTIALMYGFFAYVKDLDENFCTSKIKIYGKCI